jgi:hypothetical protein
VIIVEKSNAVPAIALELWGGKKEEVLLVFTVRHAEKGFIEKLVNCTGIRQAN